MAKNISYINTDPRKNPVGSSSGSAPSRPYSPGFTSSPSGMTLKEVADRIIPVIAENYADMQTEIERESFLYNPSFSNEADGWTIKEEDWKVNVRIQVSDDKKRMFLSSGGTVQQLNEKIRKPGKRYEYVVPETTDESSAASSDGVQSRAAGVTIKTIAWPELEIPENVQDKYEKPEFLYLSLEFICHKDGVLGIGFKDSGMADPDSLPFVERAFSKSDQIQVIEEDGTWDGSGYFHIGFTEGEIEIISLRLYGKPLEDYRKQTDSFIKQTLANLKAAYKTLEKFKERDKMVQDELNVLYGNDNTLDKRIEELDKKIDEVDSRVDSVSGLSERIDSLSESLDALSKRLDELEKG